MKVQNVFSSFSVRDIDEAKNFYGTTLGLSFSEQMGGIDFDVNGSQTHIYPKDSHVPADFTVLNFIVEDINVTVDELASSGVVFERYDDMPGEQDEKGIMHGKDAGMGPNIAWFKDPSSNVLSVVEV